MKYSGADWIRKYLNQVSVDTNISDFAVKVANVLGQTYLGIYHIPVHALFKKKNGIKIVNWECINRMQIVVRDEFATYDFPRLTVLYLCCKKAGIICELHGSFKDYTKILFVNTNPCKNNALLKKIEQPVNTSFKDLLNPLVIIKKDLGSFVDVGTSKPDMAIYTIPHLSWESMEALVYAAHHHLIRMAVQGRSPRSLELSVFQRKTREGEIHERHPKLQDQIELFKQYTDIDYDKI